MKSSKGLKITYWLTTGFFAVWMSFTVYAQLMLPQLKETFAHLGYPDYFRIELSIAKAFGILVLLLPLPARLKEWAYAGFTITLVSALVAHLAVGDGVPQWSWSAVAGLVLAGSYVGFRKMESN